MKNTPITDLELKAIVDHEVKSALGELGGELSDARSGAMDRYLGEATGKLAQSNPERSSVVMTTVRDTIEWLMPQVMRTLAQADSIAEFDAIGVEDEEKAKQETQAINHIIWRKNEGFLQIYTWIKDALLQKNGIMKFWIEEFEEISEEEFDGLTSMKVTQMLQDPELTAKEYDVSEEVGEQGETLYQIVFERHIKEKRIRISAIPPEEWLCSGDATSIDIQTAPPRFCGHRTEKYCSELRSMRFSEADIEEMKQGDEKWDELDEEWIARYNLSDEQEYVWSEAAHESLIPIRIIEGYMNIDMDGDGYAELVRIWRAGNFIQTEKCDRRPFACLTPIILSHKFVGLSVDDLIEELQEVHTAIMRNTLDNMYQVNNARPVVNERVDTDSLLTSRPGAPIYVDDEGSVGDAVMPYAPPAMWKDGIQMMEYIDGVRKDRTGIGDETMGLDPAQMAQANTGVVLSAVEAAKGKVELIARIFAETGIKWLFRGVHELCRKSMDQTISYQMNRQHVEADPRDWCRRMDMTVNVGTATGNLQQDLFAFTQLFQIQEKMAAGGMMGKTLLPQNIYALAKDFAESLDQYGEKYFFNPMMLSDPKVQELVQMQLPQQSDPQMEAVKAMAESEKLKAQISAQRNILEARKAESDAKIKQEELILKSKEAAGELELEEHRQQISAGKEQLKAETDGVKARNEVEKHAIEQNAKMEIEQVKAQKEAQSKAIEQNAKMEIEQVKAQKEAEMQDKNQAHEAEMQARELNSKAEMQARDQEFQREIEQVKACNVADKLEVVELRKAVDTLKRDFKMQSGSNAEDREKN